MKSGKTLLSIPFRGGCDTVLLFNFIYGKLSMHLKLNIYWALFMKLLFLLKAISYIKRQTAINKRDELQLVRIRGEMEKKLFLIGRVIELGE